MTENSPLNKLRELVFRERKVGEKTVDRRCYIYNLLRHTEDPISLLLNIKKEAEVLFKDNCLKLIDEPFVDIIFSILSDNLPSSCDMSAVAAVDLPKLVPKEGRRVMAAELPIKSASITTLWKKHQPIILTASDVIYDASITRSDTSIENISDSSDTKSEEHSEMFKIFKKVHSSGEPRPPMVHFEKKIDVQDDYISQKDFDDLIRKKRKLSAATSLSSTASESSNTTTRACMQAKKSFIDFSEMENVTEVNSDRLHMDVIIVCKSVEMCRMLSVTFGLVGLDDIILKFHNEKKSTKIPYYFNDKSVGSQIRTLWKQLITQPADGHHKTMRFVQTRFAEYLACGFHNIGITCSEMVTTHTTANFYGALEFEGDDLMKDYTFVIRCPNSKPTRFIDTVQAFSQLINLALSYDVSVACVVKFDEKYYNIKLSLICIIPFYVLRAVCEEDICKMIIAKRYNRQFIINPTFPVLQ